MSMSIFSYLPTDINSQTHLYNYILRHFAGSLREWCWWKTNKLFGHKAARVRHWRGTWDIQSKTYIAVTMHEQQWPRQITLILELCKTSELSIPWSDPFNRKHAILPTSFHCAVKKTFYNSQHSLISSDRDGLLRRHNPKRICAATCSCLLLKTALSFIKVWSVRLE